MKRVLQLSLIATVSIFAAAYKLPEQSINGTALGAANVASCDGADCAFYNSANSVFLDPNSQYVEVGGTFVHLPAIEYNGKQNLGKAIVPANAKSKEENIPIPYLHYVSKAYGNYRYGLSVTVPGGLVKRWESPIQKLYAQKFELDTVNINPFVAYKVNKNFAVSAGLNIVYSKGIVKSDGSGVGLPLKRDMDGDSIDYGYNLAATLHLDNGINLAATYRSKVKLSEEGDATLTYATFNQTLESSVNIYLPAALSLAISKDIDKTTIEFVYERTFWSSYKTLDFNYNTPLPASLQPLFDAPIPKNWKDTNTFRVGLKYRYSDKLTLMAGYSYDQSPIKEQYLNYELPDSDAHVFSAGFHYQQNKNLGWGVAVLYDYKKNRTVNNGKINGKFTKGGALLVTAGVTYKF